MKVEEARDGSVNRTLGIVVSLADSASVHIGEQLLAIGDWEAYQDDTTADGQGGGTVYRQENVELREFGDLHLDLSRPAAAFDDPSLVVFASRHSGDTGPLLTAHHTGNFGPADHGGEDNAVARACPNAHAIVIEALETHAPDGYDVGMECTHHGPSEVGAPSMFVEVGSAEPQWEDPDAARAVARAILELVDVTPDLPPETEASSEGQIPTDSVSSSLDDRNRRHLVGFGGGHYAPRFERVIRETNWTVGHVAADWGLEAMGDLHSPDSSRVIEAAFEASRAAYALVDGSRPDVETAVEELGYRAVSETWVRETDGVGLAFVRALETAVASIDDGLRFGEQSRKQAESSPSDWTVETLPGELLDEVFGIDRDATVAAVAEPCLAFVTAEGGTRPSGTVVLDDGSDRDEVIDRLVVILEQRYDDVERSGDVVVARQETFDPERARTLGIPDGPAFGKLAAGQPVEIDGETIPPAVVQTEDVREFPLR